MDTGLADDDELILLLTNQKGDLVNYDVGVMYTSAEGLLPRKIELSYK